MRWLYASIILCLMTAAGATGYLYLEHHELAQFCATLPLGASIAQVREAAREKGFDPVMEPFAQMRIAPSIWPAAPPACRVFFNRAQTVEYRSWQTS